MQFQVFKQSQWKPKRTLLSSDEQEGSWMSMDPQVLVIDQASTVGSVRYRVRTFKAAEHDKPEHRNAAFQVGFPRLLCRKQILKYHPLRPSKTICISIQVHGN